MMREELERKIQEETELIARLKDTFPTEQNISCFVQAMELVAADERLRSLKSQLSALSKDNQSMQKTRFWKTQQSLNYEEIIFFDGFLFKCEIKRDAFDEQSYLHVFIFSLEALKWNSFLVRDIKECKCAKHSVYAVDAQKEFAEDSANALNDAKELLAIVLLNERFKKGKKL